MIDMAMNVRFKHKDTGREVILYSYPINKSDGDREMCAYIDAEPMSMQIYVMNKDQFFEEFEKVPK